jgi:phosphoribosylformylglycinamidine synthase subunit PurQ / glutaminase
VRWGVVTFPGTNDDRDTLHIVRDCLGQEALPLWHKDTSLGGVECVVLPGGFSYGDYLRCGAIARFSPIMTAVKAHADAGGLVMGICNGFQVLCESGLLPGALVRNRSLRFVCRDVSLRVESVANPFTNLAAPGDVWRIPVKHGEGCYVADDATLDRLERDGQVLLRYCRPDGSRSDGDPGYNPNGSARDIAGIMNSGRNVFGLMPHPEHAADPRLESATREGVLLPDGLRIFRSIVHWISEARNRPSVESAR